MIRPTSVPFDDPIDRLKAAIADGSPRALDAALSALAREVAGAAHNRDHRQALLLGFDLRRDDLPARRLSALSEQRLTGALDAMRWVAETTALRTEARPERALSHLQEIDQTHLVLAGLDARTPDQAPALAERVGMPEADARVALAQASHRGLVQRVPAPDGAEDERTWWWAPALSQQRRAVLTAARDLIEAARSLGPTGVRAAANRLDEALAVATGDGRHLIREDVARASLALGWLTARPDAVAPRVAALRVAAALEALA